MDRIPVGDFGPHKNHGQNPEEIDQNSHFYSKSLKNHVFRGKRMPSPDLVSLTPHIPLSNDPVQVPIRSDPSPDQKRGGPGSKNGHFWGFLEKRPKIDIFGGRQKSPLFR